MSQGSLGLPREPALDCTTLRGGRQEPSSPCSRVGPAPAPAASGIPAGALPGLAFLPPSPGARQLPSHIRTGTPKTRTEQPFPSGQPSPGSLAKCFVHVPRPSQVGLPASHHVPLSLFPKHTWPLTQVCTFLQEHLCYTQVILSAVVPLVSLNYHNSWGKLALFPFHRRQLRL